MSRMTITRMITRGRSAIVPVRGLSGEPAGAMPLVYRSSAQREAWFNALPQSAQKRFINQTQALYRSLPMPLQQALTRYMISIGEKVPFASGMDGYGPVGALGQWAELATAIAQIGGSIYNRREDGKLSEMLQSNALNSDANITAARNAAANQAAQIVADAQRATAAQLAASNQTAAQITAQQSRDNASASVSSVKTIAVAGAAVAALGIVAYVILKKK